MNFLSKIVEDYIIAPVGSLFGRQVVYVIECRSNLAKLDAQVEKLKAAKESVDIQVVQADGRGEIIDPTAKLWLENVNKITAKTDELLKDENKAKLKCFHGFCPNLTSRRKQSSESTKLLEEVVDLDQNRGFSTVSCGPRLQEVCSVPTGDYQAFDSRRSTMDKIMAELNKTNTKRIGVYGIGGVGKTTLVEQVYRKALEDEIFHDVVILLDVKTNPDPEAIQKKIVEKLGMKISESEDETMDKRASRLCGRIQGKKVLVILDDVWERIDLKVVGIPDVGLCKILLTSRSRTVLKAMSTKPDFILNILQEEETWVLFESKAGDIVQNNPAIRTVAKQVAKLCGGLPVLVVAVASSLENRATLEPWNDALRCLKMFDSEEDSTKKAWMGLEWSYNQLNDKLKPLFLLCGITIRGNNIILADLLRYSVGLGFFGKTFTLEEARNALYTQVEKLKDFCLLIDSDDKRYVRMHDLVRDVANQIARRDQHILSSVVDGGGGELEEWQDTDFLEKCTTISFPRENNIPRLKLPEVMQCPALKMFLLRGDEDRDDSLNKSHRFFEEMKQLKVLHLEKMWISPIHVLSLQNVQTLCLEDCQLGDMSLLGKLSNLEILSFAYSKFYELPKELAQLTHLRLLDLSYCNQLEKIPGGVISSLTRLEDLRMNRFHKWKFAEYGEHFASLSELKHLSRLAALEIQIRDAEFLPTNLFSCKLERYQISIGRAKWKSDRGNDRTLNILKIGKTIQLDEGLKMLVKKSETLYLAGTFGVKKDTLDQQVDTEDFQQVKYLLLQNNCDLTYIVNSEVVFPSLTTLVVHKCRGLRFLFSSSTARSLVELKHLEVVSCDVMEEILLSTRGEDGEGNMDKMFPKLQSLRLESLPKLVRFCTSSYIEFPSLEELKLEDCFDLGSFIWDPTKENGSEEKLNVENETALQYSLFDEKVGFRCLERLQIVSSRKLKTIWHNQLVAHQDSFSRLRHVDISDCDSLINIFPGNIRGRLNALKTMKIKKCKSLEVVFELITGSIDDVKPETAHVNTSSSSPASYCHNLDSVLIQNCGCVKSIFPAAVARSLEKLHELTVWHCDQLEGIIVEEASTETTTPPPQFVFPNVTSLVIGALPLLKSFCTVRMHTSKWPSLKKLVLDRMYCKVFASPVSFFREKHHQMDPDTIHDQPLFLIDKDSFPELEELKLDEQVIEIWYGDGPSPADFFTKLKSLHFEKWARFSKQAALLFIQNLQNLEKLIVIWDESDEIFVDEGSDNSGEIHALPGVRHLRLEWLRNLLHLGESQSAASPVFPNLQCLEVLCCTCLRLNSLESSAISFRNLTTLKVHYCRGLKYLISYSVAKSLVQLTTLEVDDCENIEVIIATDGDDEITNLNWPLQHLKLSKLPRIQGFCSRNCIVEFPSLQTFEVTGCSSLEISPPNADGVRVLQIREEKEW